MMPMKSKRAAIANSNSSDETLMADNLYHFGAGKHGTRIIISKKESVVV